MSHEAKTPVPSSPLRWFPEFWELGRKRLRPQVRLLGLSLVVGFIAGMGAIVFFAACQVVTHFSLDMIAGYRPHVPLGEPGLFKETAQPFHPWLILAVIVAGGICSGLIVYTFAPEAEGHGTDAAIDSYHHRQGFIRPIVPLVKIIASALTLGTGGSGGREGPIAQIGAGFGSFLGNLLRLRPAERRILMAAGMGAGVAAIFRAPLAGALFAAEVLYRSPDFESEVIIPAGLACVIAYCTFGYGLEVALGEPGWKPLFVLSPALKESLAFNNPFNLFSYTLLAVFLVLLAMIYTRSFYLLTHLFKLLPLKSHFKPAIGALLTGLVGLGLYFLLAQDMPVLTVLSFGYGIIQDALSKPIDEITFYFGLTLLAVAFGKILTTGLTIGSGGSGGIFGPSMVIGGCGGGALGIFLMLAHRHLEQHFAIELGPAPHPAKFVIIGMAGFFAAAAKTPFSTLIMVSEMTGNYDLLLPTLWVCTIAFLLSDEQSIYSSQVESRSRSPAHQGDYVRDVLTGLRVSQYMTPLEKVPVLHPADRLDKVVNSLGDSSYQALPVTDETGRLLGVITLEEAHLAAVSAELRSIVVAADLMRGDVVPLRPDDRLDRALELFVENDLAALPVVDGTIELKLLGLVKRSDISGAYLKHVQGDGKERGA
jgi:CIC family chloride channel protein